MIPLPSLSEQIAPISAALDSAAFDARLNWMRGLGKKELVALWSLTDGQSVPVDYFYGAPGEIVIHEGQNSMLLFNQFQKRMVLHEGRAQGYNHQSMSWLTGPGHFLLMESDGAAYFDYTRTVPAAPAEFPAVKPNDVGLSRFVYGGMIDKVRRVAADLIIGAAYRGGAQTGDYFLLLKHAPHRV